MDFSLFKHYRDNASVILGVSLLTSPNWLRVPVRQMVSELFRKVQDSYIQQRELGWRGKGLRQQPSTAASHFLQSLSELTTRLERCSLGIKTNPKTSSHCTKSDELEFLVLSEHHVCDSERCHFIESESWKFVVVGDCGFLDMSERNMTVLTGWIKLTHVRARKSGAF